ncbi:BppU family phage baseplate upper protein [Enterococcus malodoratus]|uniref:BppU family phage baseplate upper protein n=1 Tax=Enterococcus malodoratus TaxID=71451 RepID=UPI0039B0B27A
MSEVLRFDLAKDPKGNPITYGRVGDGGGFVRKIKVFEDGKPFDLTGWIPTFEGNTSDYKTKVFDSEGITITDEKSGEFTYTFPNMAFAVEGQYERAYFSFTKENQRKSTGNFEIIVFGNSDIDAPEAETIITEYNKLVAELQALQKENIEDLQKQQNNYIQSAESKFGILQGDIAKLQKQIDTFKSDVNTAASNAVTTINKALEEFKDQDFYTKLEADNRFAKKTDLTKENVQLGNVDNYATANQTEAEQGIALNKFVTPMGVKQHVDSRMADYSEISVGQSDDKMISPKTLADTIKFKEVFKEGIALSNVANEGTLVPHGDSVGGSLNHVNNRPYTVNSDGSFTFKRATNLLVTGGTKLVVGDTNPTDYLHVNAYVNNALNEFIALGATAATNGTLRLTWSAMGQRVISVNSGDVLSLKIGLRSGKQAFAVQLTSLKIEEV